MHAYALTDQTIPVALYELPAADGVAVFFVLSGFLIGRILIKTFEQPTIRLSTLIGFWIRRWFRTLPNYYLILTVLVVYGIFFGHGPVDQIWRYFLFSQNIFSVHPAFFPEAWSLTIEEWFYLLLPIPLYILAKNFAWSNRKAFIWVIALTIIMVTAFRIWKVGHYNYQTLEAWDNHLRKQVSTRMDSLMYGVLGAYISVYFKNAWNEFSKPLLVLGLIILMAAKVYYYNTESIWFLNYVQLSLMPIITLMLLPFLSGFRLGTGCISSSITFISLISYSMYLLNHTVMLEIVMPRLSVVSGWCESTLGISRGGVSYSLYWLCTILLSWVIYRFFEVKITICRELVVRRLLDRTQVS